MINLLQFKGWVRFCKFLYGIMLIFLGVFILISMLNTMFEDINHNFRVLRLLYAWNCQYFSIHIWVYSILMIIYGVGIITSRGIKYMEFMIIGFIVFFLHLFFTSLSIINLIMSITSLLFYFFYYHKHRNPNETLKYGKKILISLLTHTLFIFVSISISTKFFMMIVRLFSEI